jgi:hypothetical protein
MRVTAALSLLLLGLLVGPAPARAGSDLLIGVHDDTSCSSCPETVLGGWQSGLLWADWKRKPAFEAYRAAIAEVRRGAVDCSAVLRGA